MAFLNRQYRTIAVLVVVAAVLVFVMLAITGSVTAALQTAVAMLVGAIFSALAGFIGMYVAVRSNIRTASAARRSLGEALTIALRGGAVSGFLVVSLSLLGVFVVFVAYGGLEMPEQLPSTLWGMVSAPALWRCLPNWGEASTRRRPMWAQTSSAKSKRESLKMILETPRSSPTLSATT